MAEGKTEVSEQERESRGKEGKRIDNREDKRD